MPDHPLPTLPLLSLLLQYRTTSSLTPGGDPRTYDLAAGAYAIRHGLIHEFNGAGTRVWYCISNAGRTMLTDQRAQLERMALAAPALLTAIKDLVAGIERAAASGVDLGGSIGVGDAFRAIRLAEDGF